MLNNYSHIVSKPRVEKKTTSHYYHIKNQFGCAYLSHKDFLNRKDLSVIVMRNGNNHIVGLTLIKKITEVEKKITTYPSSPFPKNSKQIGHYNWGYYRQKPIWNSNTKRLYVRQMPKEWIETEFQYLQVIFTLVSEKFRGMGYNQILLDYVYNKAIRTKKCRKIIAHIRESNIASLKSFQKNGYRVSKKWTKDYKNGDKKIRMYRNTVERKEKTVDADTIEKINKIIKDYKTKKILSRISKIKKIFMEKVKEAV
jgi:RimJ/RimL family protein N-acetyltransferase